MIAKRAIYHDIRIVMSSAKIKSISGTRVSQGAQFEKEDLHRSDVYDFIVTATWAKNKSNTVIEQRNSNR